MVVQLNNAGLPQHAHSRQFYNALKNYDVHNVLRQHCKMLGDMIEREVHGLAEWEENFLKNNGESEVFRSTGHRI
jgi:putative heme iron utilization protein